MITDVKRERVAMTKKEAITVMQLYKDELEHRIAKIDYDIREIDLYSIHLDAFEVAIEALSADAVHIEVYRDLYEKYVELKHASAETVQGEWIRKNYHTYICNQCGYEEAIYGNVEEYRFCSHCGAKMTP